MIDIILDAQKSFLHIKPKTALTADDFIQIGKVLDPYLAQNHTLKGLMIETLQFPGWENFSAFKAHLNFIKNHQSKVKKIALVTNSKFADFAKNFIAPFVAPEIKHFPYDQTEAAKQWIFQ